MARQLKNSAANSVQLRSESPVCVRMVGRGLSDFALGSRSSKPAREMFHVEEMHRHHALDVVFGFASRMKEKRSCMRPATRPGVEAIAG